MATATPDTGPGALASAASSAAEFVRDRLEDSDVPLSPSELAEEYGCTSGHMRDVCSELNAEGAIERPDGSKTGLYTDPGDDTEGSDADGSDAMTADLPGALADTEGSEQMPTQEEYERQHSRTDGETADASAEGSDDGEPADSDGGVAGGTAAAGAAAAGAALPIDPMDLAKIAGIAIALWLTYRLLVDVPDGTDTVDDGGAVEDDQDGGLGGGLTG